MRASCPPQRHARQLLLLCILLLTSAFPLIRGQNGGCEYSGPYADGTLAFALTLLNTSAASLPPLFSIQFIAALDADLQTSSLLPTASTVPDLQCESATAQQSGNSSSTLLSLLILGTLTVDTGVTPLAALSFIIADVHDGSFQSNSGYLIPSQQHVPSWQVCSDGSALPLNSTSQCAGSGGGGGLAEGVVVDIVILVLVVLASVFGIVAWKWLKWKKESELRA